MNSNELRIKVNGGYLIAEPNPDPDYEGISILFEAKNGCLIDIVTAECKAENNKSIIDVYCYEDVYTEDFTRKFSLNNEELIKVVAD